MRRRMVIGAAAAVASMAIATASASAQSEPAQSEPAWLVKHVDDGPGGPWSMFGWACGDEHHEIELNVIPDRYFRPKPPVPPGCGPSTRPDPGAIRADISGAEAWKMIWVYGTTTTEVDRVDVKINGRWRRTRPIAPPPAARAAGLPTNFRLYYAADRWKWHGHDGPFQYGAVAVSNRRVVGCDGEVTCTKGAVAKRAGKYVKNRKRARRGR